MINLSSIFFGLIILILIKLVRPILKWLVTIKEVDELGG